MRIPQNCPAGPTVRETGGDFGNTPFGLLSLFAILDVRTGQGTSTAPLTAGGTIDEGTLGFEVMFSKTTGFLRDVLVQAPAFVGPQRAAESMQIQAGDRCRNHRLRSPNHPRSEGFAWRYPKLMLMSQLLMDFSRTESGEHDGIMKTDSFGTDAAPPDTASESAANPGALQTAIFREIMAEQLDYLPSHRSPACSPACLDCRRLEQVIHWLLLPFASIPGERRAVPIASVARSQLRLRARRRKCEHP